MSREVAHKGLADVEVEERFAYAWWTGISLAIDGCFITDIFVQCRLAYSHDGAYVTDGRKIAILVRRTTHLNDKTVELY